MHRDFTKLTQLGICILRFDGPSDSLVAPVPKALF